jgi:hypothetical protein
MKTAGGCHDRRQQQLVQANQGSQEEGAGTDTQANRSLGVDGPDLLGRGRTHTFKRGSQILQEKRIWPSDCFASTDHHIIPPSQGFGGKNLVDGGPQATPGAIALNRDPDLFRRREPDPDAMIADQSFGRWSGLKNKSGCGPLAALTGNPQEIRPLQQTHQGGAPGLVPRRKRVGDKGFLCGHPLAALTATAGDDAAAADGGHTGTEAVAAGADELAGLISTLHGKTP